MPKLSPEQILKTEVKETEDVSSEVIGQENEKSNRHEAVLENILDIIEKKLREKLGIRIAEEAVRALRRDSTLRAKIKQLLDGRDNEISDQERVKIAEQEAEELADKIKAELFKNQ